MSEIDGPKISVNQVNFNGIVKQPQEQEMQHAKEEFQQLTDFSDAKAEAMGRSLLFKGADNINADLKALTENPKIAERSDQLFELAYAEAQRTGLSNPYEEAASASTTAF